MDQDIFFFNAAICHSYTFYLSVKNVTHMYLSIF